MPPALRFWLCAAVILFSGGIHAGDGPFGIDHRVHYDNSGIRNRSNQNALLYGTLGCALVFGDNDQRGDTFWYSVDAMAVAGPSAEAMQYTFQRKRPAQTDDPDKFFSGSHAQSFPSGEVAAISAAVTPFIVTCGRDHPAVYALACCRRTTRWRG